MQFKSLVQKLSCHAGNLLANLLPADRASKELRNMIYRAMGVRFGEGTTFAGGNYINIGEKLTIGEKCFINRACYFDLSAPITFGDRISVGTHCVFVTTNHEVGPAEQRAGPVQPSPITIGDGAWIGTRATILPGVSIGRGVIVASGAVVTKSVPDNTMVAGVPAIVKRQLDELIDHRSDRTTTPARAADI